MSFAKPLVLVALLAIPLLILWYTFEQRRHERGVAAFTTAKLIPSSVPRRPGWRRHAPMLVIALALAVLVLAAAKPQRTVAKLVSNGAVMLADDVSSSMASTDVSPSRLVAAERAATRFTQAVPSAILVGMLQFNQVATVLQSPTANHALVSQALTQLHADGHTAIGGAIDRAVSVLTALKSPSGKRVPGAIVLLSDGTSTTGPNAITAARAAAHLKLPIYTVALGTSRGSIAVKHGGKTTRTAVPLDPSELQQIASVSGGKSYTVGNVGDLKAVYQHLAVVLGHKNVKQQITSTFAGVGLALLLVGGALSLLWFGRLI